MTRVSAVFAAMALACVQVVGCAQADGSTAPLTLSEKQDVIEQLSSNLRQYYVYPDVAQEYADLLHARLTRGAYDDITDRAVFAERVSKDLDELHADRHLVLRDIESQQRVMAGLQAGLKRSRDVGGVEEGGPAADQPTTFGEVDQEPGSSHHGFHEVTILEGNVAYIEITLFPESTEAVVRAHEVMQSVKSTRAIIMDIRRHKGGGVEVIDVITSYLFDTPTHMVSMTSRAHNDGVEQKHISQPNDMSRHFTGKPVYLLISRKTGSAAEHFAAALKSTGRATLIGEPTYGAGHFGASVPISDHFIAFIPFGRTYDPNTGEDWEGVGVQPDASVEAEKALDVALALLQPPLKER